MSRSMIQVPDELKKKIEESQRKFYTNTNYGVIQKLFDYYERTEREKEAERQRQQVRMIEVQPEDKARLMAFSSDMGFRSPEYALLYLLEHYESSPSIRKEMLGTYRKLLQGIRPAPAAPKPDEEETEEWRMDDDFDPEYEDDM